VCHRILWNILLLRAVAVAGLTKPVGVVPVDILRVSKPWV
jgi:hypothetical protein